MDLPQTGQTDLPKLSHMLGQKEKKTVVNTENDNGSIEFSHTTELETFFVFVVLRVCSRVHVRVSTVIEMQTSVLICGNFSFASVTALRYSITPFACVCHSIFTLRFGNAWCGWLTERICQRYGRPSGEIPMKVRVIEFSSFQINFHRH